MTTTYAIADLHGRFDLLDAAITAIAERGGGTVVFLGDYIDRGPQSRQVVERLKAGPPKGQVWWPLAGNHETYLLSAIVDLELRDTWLAAGGRETLASYGWNGDGEAPLEMVPEADRAWMKARPNFHLDRHRVYVHAGMDPTLSFEQQSEARMLWGTYLPNLDLGYREWHVVHGHENLANGPLRLVNRTNLDTYAWKTGRLCIGVFDDAAPGGPTEVIEIRRDPDPR